MQQDRPCPQTVLTELIHEVLLQDDTVVVAIDIANVIATDVIVSMMTR